MTDDILTQCVAEAWPVKEIAETFSVNRKTVYHHMRLLGLRNHFTKADAGRLTQMKKLERLVFA